MKVYSFIIFFPQVKNPNGMKLTETLLTRCLSLFLHMTACVHGGGIHDLRDAEGRVVSYQTFLCFINKYTLDSSDYVTPASILIYTMSLFFSKSVQSKVENILVSILDMFLIYKLIFIICSCM